MNYYGVCFRKGPLDYWVEMYVARSEEQARQLALEQFPNPNIEIVCVNVMPSGRDKTGS